MHKQNDMHYKHTPAVTPTNISEVMHHNNPWDDQEEMAPGSSQAPTKSGSKSTKVLCVGEALIKYNFLNSNTRGSLEMAGSEHGRAPLPTRGGGV